MAGVTDLPFRLLCKEQGAGLLCMEMVSAKAILYKNRNTEAVSYTHLDVYKRQCKDRVYASIMGAYAVDLLIAGKNKRIVGYKNGEYVDFDINEALAMQKTIPEYQFEIAKALSYNYVK